MSLRSADNLIATVEAEKLEGRLPEPINPDPVVDQDEAVEPESDVPQGTLEDEPEAKAEPEEIEEAEPEKAEKAEKADDNTDEYGNEIPKARTYTEEEVQRMIRDRLSRGQYAQQTQQQQQQVQQAAQSFEADPNSEQSWEVQLEAFVEKTIEKNQTKQQQKQMEIQEQRAQAEFEIKFSQGMAKYPDFVSVVEGKPITDSMMRAARSMKDPAAFIYAASKQHPKEVERIAAIRDPYEQIAEVGRLEERMKKAKATSAAPKPLKGPIGDMADKGTPKRNIDDMIRKDAQRKFKR
jgi:hypothetical protein